MTKRYCDICGWKTPGSKIFVKFKGTWLGIGFQCNLCGKIHADDFPRLYLLKEDAVKIKIGKSKIEDYQPKRGGRPTKNVTLFLDEIKGK